MKVLIRVDCDESIGTGHLYRCRQIADFFLDKNHIVEFLINDHAFAKKVVSCFAFKTISFTNVADEISATRTVLSGEMFDIIFVDFYDKYENSELMQIFSSHSRHGVAVLSDDYKKVKVDSDFLIATEPKQTQYNYDQRRQKTLCGERYGIVPQEFLSNRVLIKAEAKNVLVSFGGQDPHNATYRLAKFIACADVTNVTFNFLVGGMYRHEARLNNYLKKSNIRFNIYKNLPSVLPLFLNSDVAITACGNTIYELCNLGVPVIGVGVSERQHEAGISLCEKKLIVYVGHFLEIKRKKFCDILLNLIISSESRLVLHKNCIQHFNLNGLEEIALLIERKINDTSQ